MEHLSLLLVFLFYAFGQQPYFYLFYHAADLTIGTLTSDNGECLRRWPLPVARKIDLKI